MLLDASVARSFAVVGWTRHLLSLCAGRIQVAEGVHATQRGEPSELEGIRAALEREAHLGPPGSGRMSRALDAARGLDELLALPQDQLCVLTLRPEETDLAIKLQSRRPEDRSWRSRLGAKARRLDTGEAASIAIAYHRSCTFATDDEDALVIWTRLSGRPALRTLDCLRQLVADGDVEEADARAVYHQLQTDELHRLGGPPWPDERATALDRTTWRPGA